MNFINWRIAYRLYFNDYLNEYESFSTISRLELFNCVKDLYKRFKIAYPPFSQYLNKGRVLTINTYDTEHLKSFNNSMLKRTFSLDELKQFETSSDNESSESETF